MTSSFTRFTYLEVWLRSNSEKMRTVHGADPTFNPLAGYIQVIMARRSDVNKLYDRWNDG